MHLLSSIRSVILLSTGLAVVSSAPAQECSSCCPQEQALTCAIEPATTTPAPQVVETRVNTYTHSTQHEPTLAVAEDGRVLVAWGSRRQELGSYGVFAQLLDPLGRPIGTELHVNSHMPGAQYQPAAAFAPNGSAYVAWCSQGGQDGQFGGVYLRRMAEGAQGFAAQGDEILVNETRFGDQVNPSLTVVGDQLLVSWVSDHLGDRAVFARRFDLDGQPLGGEFRLSEAKEGHEALPSIASLEGGFVAVYQRTEADHSTPAGVFARLFDAEGQARGAEFAVHDRADSMAVEPMVDSDGLSQFMVSWMSLASDKAGDYQVRARRYSCCGSPVGDAFTVAPPSTDEGYLNGASVAMAADGRALVAWNLHKPFLLTEQGRPQTQVSILGQRFAADGSLDGQVERLNQNDDGRQDLSVGLNGRHLAWSTQDQIAMAWYGDIEGDGSGIGLTLYAPSGLNPEAPAPVEPVAALRGLTRAELDAQVVPPDWDPNWVDDSYNPNPPAAGTDFGFTAFNSTGWTPPDPDLAVGPNHIVAVVNVDMKFYTKSGTETFSTPLESWFGTSNGFHFDPVALYDEQAQRYVVAAVEHNSGDFYNIAVSDDDDPNGTWYKYRFNLSSICGFVDFPNLGVSADAYFLVADCFGGGGNYIHIMDKSKMLTGSAVTLVSKQASTGIISNGAIRNYDDATVYTASTYAAGSPNLKLYAIKDPLGAATVQNFNLFVGSFSNPPDAVQKGTSNRADTIDHRIKNGVVRNGHMYLVHTVSHSGVAHARWYHIDLRGWPNSGNTPVNLDSGYIDPGSGIYTWFADVNVDANGNMALAHNRSSSNEYIGVYRTFRLAGDPAGTLRTDTEMQTSTSPETGSRWGDYSGLEEDPVQPGTFWSHTEYRTSSWRTWVGHFDAGGGGVIHNLTLTFNLPINSGTTETATVDGSVWLTPVHLYHGTGAGTTTIPSIGVDLEIANGKKLMTRNADSSGTATFSRFVPNSLAGRTVFIQAVDDLGNLSNVVDFTIL